MKIFTEFKGTSDGDQLNKIAWKYCKKCKRWHKAKKEYTTDLTKKLVVK